MKKVSCKLDDAGQQPLGLLDAQWHGISAI